MGAQVSSMSLWGHEFSLPVKRAGVIHNYSGKPPIQYDFTGDLRPF